MLRSATVKVVELTVDVVPCTVRFPVTVKASLTCTIPVPLPANTKLVSVDFDVSESDIRPEPNVIPLPAELVILLPSSICTVDLSAIRPVPVASNWTSPEPDVCTLTFWLASADTTIEPEESSNTFCPLTYSDPGPTYKSLHCSDELPSENVSSALGNSPVEVMFITSVPAASNLILSSSADSSTCILVSASASTSNAC